MPPTTDTPTPTTNPPGRTNPNLALAPRCGARTRAGCPCRAPAIRGKLRCRMHGGRSTGPRTQEGLARLRAARTIHGRYTADARARLRHCTMMLQRARAWSQAIRLITNLPPDLAQRLLAIPPEFALPPPPTRGITRRQDRALAQAEATALTPWRLAIAAARAARRRKPRAKPHAPATYAPENPTHPCPPSKAHAPEPARSLCQPQPAPPRTHAPGPATPRPHPAVAIRPSLPTEPHAPERPDQLLLPARMKLRDRFLGTSTHDGTLNDAVRTLGWNWIAVQIAHGDARLGRWLSSPISSSTGPLALPAIRWS